MSPKSILNENKDLLKLIAETLLEEETITKEQIDYLVNHGHLPKEEEQTNETTNEEQEKKETKKAKENSEK